MPFLVGFGVGGIVNGSRPPGKDYGRVFRDAIPGGQMVTLVHRTSHLAYCTCCQTPSSSSILAIVDVGGKHGMNVPTAVRDCIKWIWGYPKKKKREKKI